jgi:mevalonate kinase
MNKTFSIPAKTFLIGEYNVIDAKPGIVITTTPCFRLSLQTSSQTQIINIHKDSPAGLFVANNLFENHQLNFEDPYDGAGGLGASTAQFIGVYQALQHIKGAAFSPQKMLKAYLTLAYNGQGSPPSGYDLWAQTHSQLVYFHKYKNDTKILSWPFSSLSIVLLRTGKKLATHLHLSQFLKEMPNLRLSQLVNGCKKALQNKDCIGFINAINGYHEAMSKLELVAKHSKKIVAELMNQSACIAAKGCGAMGADIVLAIIPTSQKEDFIEWLANKPWSIVATEADIYHKH